MKTREELQTELQDLLGSNHVYFQPPETIKMKYPCFVYERTGVDLTKADNINYKHDISYELMFITKDPDTNDFVRSILDHFRYCRYVRHFVSDGLNHEVFDLQY